MNLDDRLKIALVQFDIVWESPNKNIEKLDRMLDSIENDCDIVVLPEMFATGFAINTPSIAEKMDGETVQWMKEKASKLNIAICGSLAISESDLIFNRFVFITPQGEITYYNKRHLFEMGNEQLNFSAGNERVIVTYKNWRIMPIVCYDLRFPVWSRNNLNYDLLLVAANWPKARQHVWNTLLHARAIENQCYTIGCNRVGIDGQGIEYAGGSVFVDFMGRTISLANNDPCMMYQTIHKQALLDFKTRFPVHRSMDNFTIETEIK